MALQFEKGDGGFAIWCGPFLFIHCTTPGREHNTVSANFTVRGVRRYASFCWPRRDNLWSRWRYQAFDRDGKLLAWKVSKQKVMW